MRTLSLSKAIAAYMVAARSDALMPAGAQPLAKSSLKTTHGHLNRLRKFLGPEAGISDFTTLNLRRALADMERRDLRPRTRRGAYYAWRRFAAWLLLEGKIAVDPTLELRVPKLDVAVRARCSDQLVQDMLAACNRMADDRRAALAGAVVSLFAYTALRRGELLALRVSDVDLRDGSIHIRQGKGGKSRRLPLLEEAGAAVRTWLRVRGTCRHDYLFDFDHARRLGDVALRTLMREVAAIAGHKNDPGALPHSIRHNCATRMMRNGMELDAIRAWLGHAAITTTALYLHTDQERLREVAELAGFVRREQVVQREEKRREETRTRASWRAAAYRRDRRPGE